MEVEEPLVEKDAEYYDRYSRQYFTFGKQAMNNLGKSNVFLSGMGGLGLEIAKCVALAGSRSLIIHDNLNVSLLDLSTQYYLNESQIGQNRAAACVDKLRELNPYDISTESLHAEDLSFLSTFNCVVLTEVPLETQIRINKYCRSNGIAFISADTYGLFGWCFNDFGDKFKIFDKNGEPEKQVFLGGISNASEAEITTLDLALHDLENGDTIQLKEVKGMPELNDKSFVIKECTPTSFKIDLDTTNFPPYNKSGGLIVQVKTETVCEFQSLKESLKNPLLMVTDLTEPKMGIAIHTHYGMQALHQFMKENQRLPQPWNIDDAKILFDIAQKIATNNGFTEPLNQNIINKLSFTSRGNIISITASLGGFVAQEVVKGVSGKYTPLLQWLYFDAIELIDTVTESDYHLFQPTGDRYDAMVICIGKNALTKLADTSLFMVGAGAIGCEMIKNYAMLGLSSGKGKITITDNDIIEKSNLNRQFLFREKDIRSPKSATAANAALAMNPSLHITSNMDKVCADTEKVYTDEFIKSNDMLVNALDNVQARLYMDQRAVSNTKPLLESGTMGTKGHVQVILPHLTETYSDVIDPPEQGFPYCLIHSFPSTINHTIIWARDRFHAFFVEKPIELQKFLTDRNTFNQSLKLNRISVPILKYINKLLDKPISSFSDCVKIARVKFERLFNLKIKQILATYPPDSVDKDGKLFWTLPKRQPTPFVFDGDNENHLEFIRHYSAIIAFIFNIPFKESELSKEQLLLCCVGVVLPEFVVSSKAIITDESIKEKPKEEIDPQIYENLSKQVLSKTVPTCLTEKALRVEEFEKDDDFNHHIDFMNASSNLRAIMYGITPTDRMETKRIAGKIIPAIATTTTLVSGLVSLEIIKIAIGLPKDKFKNISLNLALPQLYMFEPSNPKLFPIVGTKASYTIWDSWEVRDSSITLSNFCNHFQTKFNLSVTGVVAGTATVYMSMFPAQKVKLPKRLTDILKDMGITKEVVELVVTFEDEDGGDVDGPVIKFWNKPV